MVTMSASEKTIHPHLHQHAPSTQRPAISLASAFCCAFRIVSLRSERTKKRWQEKQLNARAFARRGNCALGTQPPNPRAPPNTAPHLRSAGVVVVGLAASPAASAPIGHAAPPAAGAKGRPRQSKARRGLDRFPTEKWTEVTMQVTKLLDAQSCDLLRVQYQGFPGSLAAPFSTTAPRNPSFTPACDVAVRLMVHAGSRIYRIQATTSAAALSRTRSSRTTTHANRPLVLHRGLAHRSTNWQFSPPFKTRTSRITDL